MSSTARFPRRKTARMLLHRRTNMTGTGRFRIVVVVEMLQRDSPLEPWEPGPLPMVWRRDTPKEVLSDAAGRSYYLNEHLPDALYTRDGKPVRWHLRTAVGLPGVPEVILDCLEVLQLPEYRPSTVVRTVPARRGLMALHLSADAAPLQRVPSVLYDVTNFNRAHGAALRDRINELVRPWGTLANNTRRSVSLTLLTGDGPLPSPYPEQEYTHVNPDSQWLHLLLDQARVPPDGAQLAEEAARELRVSRDYHGRVDRFGCAFIGLLPDVPGTRQREVYDGIEFFVRGLYTDLMLFAVARHVLLRELSRATTNALESAAGPAQVREIKEAVLHMRRLYVRSDFAPQPPYDELLRQAVTYSGLDELQATLDKDLDDLAQQLQTRVSLQTNALLGLVTLTTLPLSITLSILQVIGGSTVDSLVLAVGLSVVVAVVLTGLTKARYLVGELRESGGRPKRRALRLRRLLQLPHGGSRRP